MLQVTKFIEGGFDLTKHEEVARGVIVSNGSHEVLVPVSEATLKELIMLYAELSGVRSADPAPETPEPKPRPAPRPRAEQARMFESPTPQAEEPTPPADLEEGFEPGEEYSDSGTGVASL